MESESDLFIDQSEASISVMRSSRPIRSQHTLRFHPSTQASFRSRSRANSAQGQQQLSLVVESYRVVACFADLVGFTALSHARARSSDDRGSRLARPRFVTSPRERGLIHTRNAPPPGLLVVCRLESRQVVTALSALYARFDAVVAEHRLHKMDTIGDAYVLVAGVEREKTADGRAAHLGPKHGGGGGPADDDGDDGDDGDEASGKNNAELAAVWGARVERVLACALGMLEELALVRDLDPKLASLDIRIGVHIGDVVGGLIGNMRPRFQLYGGPAAAAAATATLSRGASARAADQTFAGKAGEGGSLWPRSLSLRALAVAPARNMWWCSCCLETTALHQARRSPRRNTSRAPRRTAGSTSAPAWPASRRTRS